MREFTFTVNESGGTVHVTVRGGDDPSDLPVLGRLLMDRECWQEMRRVYGIDEVRVAAGQEMAA